MESIIIINVVSIKYWMHSEITHHKNAILEFIQRILMTTRDEENTSHIRQQFDM